jgi:hypothetical protein
MRIILPVSSATAASRMRRVGYRPSRNRYGDESFVRPAGGGEFPRFHIYATVEKDHLILDLHLDQRRTSYEGTRAHGGEHEGSAVEREADRIKGILL